MKISTHMLTLIDTASETVKQSLRTFVENRFDGNPDELCPDELCAGLVSAVSTGLEESLAEAGRAAFKAFIEQFDTREERIVRGGRTYFPKGAAASKKFLTIFGEVEVERHYYHPRSGGKGVVPLDERWAMGGRYATPEVVAAVLYLSAMLVPGEVEGSCAELCNFKPSTSCVQDIIGHDGARLADMLEQAADGGSVPCRETVVPGGTEAFVGSLDGANVRLRRKGARAEAHGGGEGEELSSYKNAMVGSFSFYKRVDGVVDIDTGVEGIVPERLSSTYCARMPEAGAAGFKREFEAIARDIGGKLPDRVTKIILIDGARPLWNYVEGNPLFAGFLMLLDFFHASEHLSRLGEALFGTGSKEAEAWHEKWRYKLKYDPGAVGGILRSAARYQKRGRMTKTRREAIRKELVFFRRNRARMGYPEHVANGWPIGSGPVEAACKTIVKARLCQSGMRWSGAGGRNILALRVIHKSDDLGRVWEKYLTSRWQDAA
jgi:hypothetical protein